ncbi:MAG TPA: class I tRNA ligase family protein, partial [Candidatus Binatus sp.]|nr:class I tRNA ligase family protein [Candidatus Binatus sp.]
EHAVMHLLYARMWTKVMFDEELIGFDEPFPALRNQGVVAAADGSRMSKSKGNVVTPDAMIDKYGADALRLWELFMAPFDESTVWNEGGIAGTLRFITRTWTMMRRYVEARCPEGKPSAETLKRAHKTIQVVTEQIERLRFNTGISALMDQLNYLSKLKPEEMGRFAAETFVLMLAPMAPYVAEEVWRALGHTSSVHLESWPKFDPNLARDEMVTVIVQISGKVRDRLEVPAGTSEDDVRKLALNSEAVKRHLDGKQPKKFIFVQDKMLSIVV